LRDPPNEGETRLRNSFPLPSRAEHDHQKSRKDNRPVKNGTNQNVKSNSSGPKDKKLQKAKKHRMEQAQIIRKQKAEKT